MTTTSPPETHPEVEIKLDADDTFVLPDLAGLPGVTAVQDGVVQELEAVYLDSSDLRLIRHGTTFRRRTGGDDAGWHLKLPAAKRGRIEVRRAPGRSVNAVPPKLLGLVRVQLRGRPVAPVARISTRRTVRKLLGAGDVVLAEVADDQVVAEAMGAELTTTSWREIEVELVAGDDALLEHACEALIAAGAHVSSESSKLERALTHRLAALALPELGRTGLNGTAVGPAGTGKIVSKASGSKKAGGKGGRKKNGKKLAAKATEKAAAATGPTAGAVAIQYLAANVAALIAEDPQVRIDAEEGVHQMRVATRRLRTGLATFGPLFADPRDPRDPMVAGTGDQQQDGQQDIESLRAELKWLGGLLGVARDAQVMRLRLKKEISEQPAELVLGPVLRRVDLELGQAYRDGRAGVIEALDGDRYLALVAALEAFVLTPSFSARGTAPATTELRTRVHKACRRVQKAALGLSDVTAGGGSESDHHLHEVRIAAKRARYAAEAVGPVVGKPAKAVVTAMEQIQETLGNHQDAVVERQWLRDLAVRAFLAGENGFTFGRLHGLADARAHHDEKKFTKVWAHAQKVISAWPA